MREAFRRLTPLGWAVLVTGLAALSLGLWLRWQEFLQLGTMFLLLAVVGLLWVLVRSEPALDMTVRPHRLVEGGRQAVAELTVTAGRLPVLGPRVRVPVGEEACRVTLPVIAPGATARGVVDLPPRRRGVYEVGPVQLERSDLLQLARREIRLGGTEQLFVRPRTTELDLFTAGLANLEGTVSRQLSMSDLAFHALREYVQGDDLRHVHWRSSAKTDQLQVRQYHESRRGQVTVLLDHETASYPRDADFELAVSVAASVALRAVRDDCDTYLRSHDHIAVGRRPEAVLDVACWFERDASDFDAVVTSTAAAVPSAGLVVLVTGPARERGRLRAAADRLNRDATRLLVSCDTAASSRRVDSPGTREIVMADLAELRGLVARDLR